MLPVLGEEFQITLTVIYSLGAVASIWAAILSHHIFDWLGVETLKPAPAHQRNWPYVFLISLISQPLTFTMGAIGLWWYTVFAIIPAAHFLFTLLTIIIIDFNREPEPWEKEYKRLF